ncbi:MAG TPA: acetamidase/formamidase family protein [Chloroflexota bacterium]|nr:acetamidase/formamidase family protein [Chloroflexota bacterium]
MSTHTIRPTRDHLHGHFSRDLPPILEVEPGDTVVFETLIAGWHTSPEPWAEGEEFGTQIEPRDARLDAGHALCGPVAIRGARAGMTLEVAIGELRPGSWGWSVGGGGRRDLNRRLGVDSDPTYFRWSLDPDAMTGRDQTGCSLALRPFLGVMGMPPDEPGPLPTSPPRVCGGNIDCKELVSGTKLYLPIAVDGGLFSAGDGHGVQGDGEVSGVAIECPMERAELTLSLEDTLSLSTPRAWTPEAWITFGFHEDLDEAMIIALDAMLDLMATRYDISRQRALGLASLVVDLRITQVVNGVQGVHAVLRHGSLELGV